MRRRWTNAPHVVPGSKALGRKMSEKERGDIRTAGYEARNCQRHLNRRPGCRNDLESQRKITRSRYEIQNSSLRLPARWHWLPAHRSASGFPEYPNPMNPMDGSRVRTWIAHAGAQHSRIILCRLAQGRLWHGGGIVGSSGYRGRSLGMPNPNSHKGGSSGEMHARTGRSVTYILSRGLGSKHMLTARQLIERPWKNRYYRHSKISEARFGQLLRLFAMDLTATDAARLGGVSVRPVNAAYQHIRARLAQGCAAWSPFTGVLEADESCVGAKRIVEVLRQGVGLNASILLLLGGASCWRAVGAGTNPQTS